MNKWLRRDSFESRVDLPKGFDVSKFDKTITSLEEDDLPGLLGSTLPTLTDWLDSNPYGKYAEEYVKTEADERMSELYKLVVAYMVYSCWMYYALEGGAKATESGFVSHAAEGFDPLDDKRGAQIYKVYRERADGRAQAIRDFLKPQSCAVSDTGPITGRTFSTSRGRTVSRFEE